MTFVTRPSRPGSIVAAAYALNAQAAEAARKPADVGNPISEPSKKPPAKGQERKVNGSR